MAGLGDGDPWFLSGVGADFALIARNAIDGGMRYPLTGRSIEYAMPMVRMDRVVTMGISDSRIGRTPESPSPRGAFLIFEGPPPSEGLVPSLWNADASKQVSVTCAPTHHCRPRSGNNVEAEVVLATRSHFHVSADLRLSSQSVAAAYTEELSLGGQAWISFRSDIPGVCEALCLYLNSTFGLTVRGVTGQSNHVGRARLGVKSAKAMLVPNFAAQSRAGARAREIAQEQFERHRREELERISLAAIDRRRQRIDATVAKMLGLTNGAVFSENLQAWRSLMCNDRSFHADVKGTVDRLRAAGVLALGQASTQPTLINTPPA